MGQKSSLAIPSITSNTTDTMQKTKRRNEPKRETTNKNKDNQENNHFIPEKCKNCKKTKLGINSQGFCSGDCYWSFRLTSSKYVIKQRENRYQRIADLHKINY